MCWQLSTRSILGMASISLPRGPPSLVLELLPASSGTHDGPGITGVVVEVAVLLLDVVDTGVGLGVTGGDVVSEAEDSVHPDGRV